MRWEFLPFSYGGHVWRCKFLQQACKEIARVPLSFWLPQIRFAYEKQIARNKSPKFDKPRE